MRSAKLVVPLPDIPRSHNGWERATKAIHAVAFEANLKTFMWPCGLGFEWFAARPQLFITEHKLWPRLRRACIEAGVIERTDPYILRSRVLEPDTDGPRLILYLEDGV